MSTREPPIERLDLRFLADSHVSRGASLGMWIACMAIAVAAALGGWVLSRHWLSQDLAERLAKSSNSAEALLALEGLVQLDPTQQVAIFRGLENNNPAVVKATYRALDSQITLWQIEDSTESSERMLHLAERLASLPATIASDNRLVAGSLAARMFAYCYEKNDPELDALRKLCESVVRQAGAGSPADAATAPQPSGSPVESALATQASPNAQSLGFSALLEPPSPLAPVPRLEQNSLGYAPEPTTTGQVTTGQVTAGQLTTGQIGSGRRSMTLTVSPDPSAPVLGLSDTEPLARPAETGSQMSFSDDTESGLFKSSEVPHHSPPVSYMVQTPPVPTVARSIGDEGRNSLSVNAEIELTGFRDKPHQQVVRLLGSVQPDVRKAATYELRARGWSDRDINLAVELATSSEAGRLQLIENIATGLDDPRDWLLWMAEDGQPTVRKTAVALLHSMMDVEVERRLRMLLGRENDESVSATIRQVLMAREPPTRLR